MRPSTPSLRSVAQETSPRPKKPGCPIKLGLSEAGTAESKSSSGCLPAALCGGDAKHIPYR